MYIDTHQHFWKYEAGKRKWLTDSMTILQQDYLPEAIEPALQQHQMDGCIAVQSLNAESENDFLLQLAKENTFIQGIIGWTDLQANDVEQELATYSRNALIKGFRHIPQTADGAMLISPSFKSGVDLLSKNGFTYDVVADVEQLRYVHQLATQLPNQKFVIDHMGKPPIGNGGMADWKRNIGLFGPLQNVYCKVPGVSVETADCAITPDLIAPYLDVVVETFGTSRLMFGSNWPVCLLKTSYDAVWNLAETYFQSFSETEKEGIFGKNAMQFYNL